MKKLSILLVAAVATSSAIALAEGKGGHGKRHFDTNQDGKVSLQEALDGAKRRFEKKDKDKNGALTKEEVMHRAQGRFEKKDANKDGRITLAEAQAHARARFTERDANKDGFLTPNEAGRGKNGRGKHNKHRGPKS